MQDGWYIGFYAHVQKSAPWSKTSKISPIVKLEYRILRPWGLPLVKNHTILQIHNELFLQPLAMDGIKMFDFLGMSTFTIFSSLLLICVNKGKQYRIMLLNGFKLLPSVSLMTIQWIKRFSISYHHFLLVPTHTSNYGSRALRYSFPNRKDDDYSSSKVAIWSMWIYDLWLLVGMQNQQRPSAWPWRHQVRYEVSKSGSTLW